MRKVRREVLKTVNEYRRKFKADPLNIDDYANQAADEYAYYLLMEEPNDDALHSICESRNV